MKALVLGATGMLGHQLVQRLSGSMETWATARRNDLEKFELFDTSRIIYGVDAMDIDSVEAAIAQVQPDVVVNCIGIVKQHPLAKDALASLTINSLLPHRAARKCQEIGARFIHISTDCVFTGTKGDYTEEDPSDAEDLYGRTKFLGEVADYGALTLRTSIIGPELEGAQGLLGWFLSGHRVAKGYTHAIFSGFTTFELSRVIQRVILSHPELNGLYQVSSDPISKFELLTLIRDAFHLDTEIVPDCEVRIDRTLDSTLFREKTNYQPPSWFEMVAELAANVNCSANGGMHVSAR